MVILLPAFVLFLQAGRAARERAFQLALVDMLEYLETDTGQVAILDATNSTQERRNKVGTCHQVLCSATRSDSLAVMVAVALAATHVAESSAAIALLPCNGLRNAESSTDSPSCNTSV